MNATGCAQIPPKSRTVSLILKAVVILAAALGVILSAAAATSTFMGGKRVFMYFTIQSNLAVVAISLVGLVLLTGRHRIGTVWQIVTFAGTVSITLTGAVFSFVLAPTLGKHAWNVQNILTHVVVPLASIADFFVTGASFTIRKRNVFFAILPPLAYVIYAGIGYRAGWEFADGINYPYFFLNWGSPAGAFGFTDRLPFMGCVWWILALLLLLLAAAYGYLGILNGLGKEARRKRETGERDPEQKTVSIRRSLNRRFAAAGRIAVPCPPHEKGEVRCLYFP